MDEQQFDSIVTAADPAMIIVTAATDGGRSGCLVGFHSQVSIDPLRYGVWISRANHTHRFAVEAEHLGVHHLAESDLDLAARFGTLTGDDVDKFDGCEVETGPHGVPLLASCGRWIVGKRVGLIDADGDHTCVVVEPVEVRAPGPFTPLRLAGVADLTPGHPAGDSA